MFIAIMKQLGIQTLYIYVPGETETPLITNNKKQECEVNRVFCNVNSTHNQFVDSVCNI